MIKITTSNTQRKFVAAAVLTGLYGCSQPVSGDPNDYFPLENGRVWAYEVTTTLEDHTPAIEALTIHAREVQTMGDEPAHRRHTSTGTDYWMRSDKTGVYRIASRTPLDRNPMADEPTRYVLKKPYEVGTQWQVLTTAYVLQRRSEVPKEIRRTHKPFPMTYTIESVNDKVTVPAGSFDKCLRVGGVAAVRVYVDAQFAWRDIPLITREWYCPGLGLVKMEREEASPSRFMIGGKVAMTLKTWE